MTEGPDSLRIDKWLWFARFFKSRSLSAACVAEGHVRVNGTPVARGSHALRAGDVVTFAQGRQIRVVRVRALGDRRGPASEAQLLYDDFDAADSRTQALA